MDAAGAITDLANSVDGAGLEPNSGDLEPTGSVTISAEGDASSQADRGTWRSSSRARGQGQVARTTDTPLVDATVPGSPAEVGDVSGPDPEQVQPSDDPTTAPQTNLGLVAGEALQKFAKTIVFAGGSMVLIKHEDAVAKVITNELLLLAFTLVQNLDPVDESWAKRAYKEKMLAMLLACAIGVDEIDLAYAEAEGRRLIESARAAQAAVKAKEKAARAKVKAGKEADLGEDSVQNFLQQTCKSAFIGRSAPQVTPQLTDSTLMLAPPPKKKEPTSTYATDASSACTATASCFGALRGYDVVGIQGRVP
jgi:hypothetical protein